MPKRAFLILLAVAVPFIIHLIFRAQIMMTGYELDASKKQLNEIRSENRDLAAESARARSLEKIDNIARERLKMVTPEKINYILVTEESR